MLDTNGGFLDVDLLDIFNGHVAPGIPFSNGKISGEITQLYHVSLSE